MVVLEVVLALVYRVVPLVLRRHIFLFEVLAVLDNADHIVGLLLKSVAVRAGHVVGHTHQVVSCHCLLMQQIFVSLIFS